ncbi:MAG: phenylalanine--tRNA ligase subunit beta [Clostridia bacterium]|nr:phenylalanine--tRNA ligase subunit beta [Clostridia bacterium]
MFVSMNWIGDFVNLEGLDIPALIHRFTLSTAEVEDVIYKGRDTDGVIVARVVSVENHPSSKKLHLLKIDTGNGIVDCVCGAPNVREGLTVAFAKEGAHVCGTPITAAKVGGYISYGMCCSEAELGLSADNSGLWELSDELPLGKDLKEIYPIDDIVFEVDNKSLTNRPDLWGHYGIAREFAAIAEREFLPAAKEDLAKFSHLPAVDIDIRDKQNAYRYIGVKVDNITRHQSPVEMRIRLFYCGSRAINFLADLTNYVMLELGQPMHAFDLRKVDKIEVQRFNEPFTFLTLDHEERTIDDRVLMICSHEKPVAIAGIKGGLESGIEDDTTSLLLESATFDGVCIRKSEGILGLRTDASMRYEKMLDPELAELACARFLYLLQKIDTGATVISAASDAYVYHIPKIVIDIDKAYFDRYTGIDISSDRIKKTLSSLGFGIDRRGDAFTVTVPTWRATKDVTIKADLIEEVTRIYGYDNFEITTSTSPLYPVRPDRAKSDDNRAKDILVEAFALHEVHSYIWCDGASYKALSIDLPDNPRLINAQTPDNAILRANMTPTLLHFLAENRGFSSRYGIFEIGRVVKGYGENGLCNERKTLGIALCDKTADEEAAFLSVRDMICAIFRQIKRTQPLFVSYEPKEAFMHPANAYEIQVDGKAIGFLSVPHPSVKAKLDRKAAYAFAELDMDAFSAISPLDIQYNEPSRFPAIDIDLSFWGDASAIVFYELKKGFMAKGGEWLQNVTVADVYKSEEGTDSITFRFTFSSKEKTLSKNELTVYIEALIAYAAENQLKFKEI